jgi:hypothetical protein
VDAGKLGALQKAINKSDWPQCFDGAKEKAKFAECFNSLVGGVKRDLAEGKSSNGRP